nr:dehydrodolichyl diphosphate synthase complex subunit Nus1-like isoform X1 [Onthophagus taurus]
MEKKELFYRLVLLLLHAVVDLFDFIRYAWVYLRLKISDFRLKYAEIRSFEAQTRKLNKLPKHLTVLLGVEEPSIKDLANFIFWSVSVGIPYISFYDHKGLLKKRIDCFKSEVNKWEGIHFLFHHEDSIGYKNGFSGKKTHIKLLSSTDGRNKVAEKCREFVSIKNFDVQYIDAVLRESFEFPDPDLGVYFGKSFRLYDYPPWQIAVTEFVNIPTHYNCHRKQFLELLLRYDKCEQRLGK